MCCSADSTCSLFSADGLRIGEAAPSAGATDGFSSIATDGQVAVCGGDGLFLWDFSIGGTDAQVVKRFSAPHAGSPVTCLSLSKDGGVLVSGSKGGGVAIGRTRK